MKLFGDDFREIRFRESGLKDMIASEQSKANQDICVWLGHIMIIYILVWLPIRLGFFFADPMMTNVVLLGSPAAMLLVILICRKLDYQATMIKYILILMMLVTVGGINVLTGYKTWMLFAVPMLCTIRYMNLKLVGYTYVFTALFLVLMAYVNAYFSLHGGIMDLNMVRFSEPTHFIVDGYMFKAIWDTNADSDLVFRNSLRLMLIPNLLMLSIVTAICIMLIFLNLRMMLRAQKIAADKAKMEIEVANSRSRIMLSQIQPHFLYNTLSAIMSIDGNPDETVDALAEFGKYLRENLDVLSSENLISLSREMQHVMRYVNLEQLRFKERIRVEYDLPVKTFRIPAMTVQMLVENSIKHGISRKTEGGTVRIGSLEKADEFLVIVEDDGIGFEDRDPKDGKSHVGLANIESRLETLCGGRLEIDSTPGAGTRAVVHIPKERSRADEHTGA